MALDHHRTGNACSLPAARPDDKKLGYVLRCVTTCPRAYRPPGIAFFAAYMSTIATQLNWGTSYVINDFYKRFIQRDAAEQHYVLISRITTLDHHVISVIVTANMQTISGAWSFIIEAGAGLGLVLILRWYWVAGQRMVGDHCDHRPLIGFGIVKYATDVRFPESLFLIVAFTTVSWLAVTFLTKPTNEATLISFLQTRTPGGALGSQLPHR